MRTVSFNEMKHGAKEDYLLLAEMEKSYNARTASRILAELRRQGEYTLSGYKITRLEHALQTGTRALRDSADAGWIVGALLHDIGDGLGPQNHDRFSAEVIRPFVREEVAWAVEHHGIFQMVYYADHYGWDKNARERFRDHIYFGSCAEFCERWDQASFDPGCPTAPIARFEGLAEEVFGRRACAPEVLRPGEVKGLPPLSA